MELFRAAHAAGNDWRRVCRHCLAGLDLPPGANLGFVYASDPLSEALDLIVAELRRATGIADWVGTGGLGVCASGREHIGEGALAVMVADLPRGSYRLFDELRDGLPRTTPTSLADRGMIRPAFAIVHGDSRHARIPETITRLADGNGAFLVGGLSSSQAGAVQVAGDTTEGGISGVLITGAVPVVTGLSQGCTPIGPAREVTGLQGSWVTTLDGRPALDVLKEEVGDVLARQLDRIGGFIHVALPVRGVDRPDYLVRNLLGVDPRQGSIAIGGPLRRGDALMFVKRDGMAAQADLRRMLDDVQRRVAGRPIRGALYHACIARGPNMFGPDSAELRMIEDALGPVPLAGVFANGEIFHDRLYAYTGVLTVFL